MPNKQFIARKRTPCPLKPPKNSKYIPLTKGHYALVDSNLYKTLKRYNFSSGIETNGKNYPTVYNPKRYDPILSNFSTYHVKLHHLVLYLANIPIPKGMQVDHISGDTTDNRLSNLRVVTRSQNLRNPTNKKKLDMSDYLGVDKKTVRQHKVRLSHILGGHTKWNWQKIEESYIYAGPELQRRLNCHSTIQIIWTLTN